MKLQSLQSSSYPLPTPLETYETIILWSGTACYNTTKKTGRRMFANLQMEAVPYPSHLSKVDHIEHVKVIVYSVNPRIWSENDDLFICEEHSTTK